MDEVVDSPNPDASGSATDEERVDRGPPPSLMRRKLLPPLQLM